MHKGQDRKQRARITRGAKVKLKGQQCQTIIIIIIGKKKNKKVQ